MSGKKRAENYTCDSQRERERPKKEIFKCPDNKNVSNEIKVNWAGKAASHSRYLRNENTNKVMTMTMRMFFFTFAKCA